MSKGISGITGYQEKRTYQTTGKRTTQRPITELKDKIFLHKHFNYNCYKVQKHEPKKRG